MLRKPFVAAIHVKTAWVCSTTQSKHQGTCSSCRLTCRVRERRYQCFQKLHHQLLRPHQAWAQHPHMWAHLHSSPCLPQAKGLRTYLLSTAAQQSLEQGSVCARGYLREPWRKATDRGTECHG